MLEAHRKITGTIKTLENKNSRDRQTEVEKIEKIEDENNSERSD
jgi:hypothetical protein